MTILNKFALVIFMIIKLFGLKPIYIKRPKSIINT